MFYKVNSARVSIREFLYEGNFLLKPLVLLIALVTKLFRIRLPSSTDIPPVRSLRDFEKPFAELPSEFLESLLVDVEQLAQEGFTVASAFSINDVMHNTRYASVVMISSRGDAIVWVRDRRWPQLPASNRFVRTVFFSLGLDNSVVATTNAKRDLLDPQPWKIDYYPKLNVAKLLLRHREHVDQQLGAMRPRTFSPAEATEQVIELQRAFAQYQLERGIFEIPTEAEQAIHAVSASTIPSDSDELAPVVSAVRQIETKQTQWFVKILMLIASVGFFVGLGAGQWGWELVLLLVPILFVHELGHLLAMKIFGYKNMQMFFIPFLGAAVTGRKLRVPGWKKAMVSLAGPVPSIGFGLIVGAVGVFMDQPLLQKACVLTLVINVLNLAPLLPLDGGWVAHITLFSRSAIIDILFRITTILLLFTASIVFGDKFLMYIGIFMIVGLPAVWRIMQVRDVVRKESFPEPLDDMIPEQAIRQIATQIQASKIPAANVKQLAQTTVQVYEALSAHPPSWPATFGIWTLHGGSVCAALLGGSILFAVHQFRTNFNEQFADLDLQRTDQVVELKLDPSQFRLGSEPLPTSDLLMWEHEGSEPAQAHFEVLKEQKAVTIARLDKVVFASVPTEAAKPLEMRPFDGKSMRLYYEQQESQSSEDARLNSVGVSSTRKRKFSEKLAGYPALRVEFSDPTTAKQVRNAIIIMPYLPEPNTRLPIPPWSPRIPLTDQQMKVRRLLAILLEEVDELPWNIEKEPSLPIAKLDSEQARKDYRQIFKERHDAMLARKAAWIATARERASGPMLELLNAYQLYSEELKAFEEAYAAQRKSPPPKSPDLYSKIQSLHDHLGLMPQDHPDYRFTTRCSAWFAEEGDEDEDAIETDQQLLSDRRTLLIELQSAPDPAAAFSGLIAWLRKQGTTKMHWEYTTLNSQPAR